MKDIWLWAGGRDFSDYDINDWMLYFLFVVLKQIKNRTQCLENKPLALVGPKIRIRVFLHITRMEKQFAY